MTNMTEILRTRSLIAFYFGTGAANGLYAADHPDETPKSVLRALRRRSYRDMSRTLRGAGAMSAADRTRFEEFVDGELAKFLVDLADITDQEEFDLRHHEWCRTVMGAFNDLVKEAQLTATMTYGQAQKWLNMFLKYAAVLDLQETRDAYQWFHVPIDRRVYDAMRKQEITIGSSVAWSKLDRDQYTTAQESLRDHCASLDSGRGIPPLDWEAQSWISTEG